MHILCIRTAVARSLVLGALLAFAASADDGFGPGLSESDRQVMSVTCIPEKQALDEWEWALTMGELYDIACDAAGTELDRDAPRYAKHRPAVGFRALEGAVPALSFWVCPASGAVLFIEETLSHYWLGVPHGLGALRRVVREVRDRFLQPSLQQVEWQWFEVPSSGRGVFDCYCQERPRGATPVMPRPWCHFRVDARQSFLRSFTQWTDFDRLDAEPAITFDEALATLAAHAELGELELSTKKVKAWERDPFTIHLWHGPSNIYYNIAFVAPRKGFGKVDALTGEVIGLQLVPEPEPVADEELTE